MPEHFQQLKTYVGTISDLNAVAELLEWDQQVYMPEGAGADRAGQIAAIAELAHEKATSPAYETLLASAEKESFPADSPETAILRKLRRDFEKERKVPAKLVSRLAEASASTQNCWMLAKEKSDFSLLAPAMEKLVELKREYAALFPEYATPYDALLDDYEEGLTAAEVDSIFAPLRTEQTAILRKILEKDPVDDSFLRTTPYDGARQMTFCREVITRMGYDWSRGRLDMTEHPFTTSFGLNDVRITTKIKETEPLSCLFSCIHEAGHALYEQGIDPDFNRTPLADGASLGFHESQSRFWENIIGRSAEFWQFHYPRFRELFPGQLAGIDLKTFLRAVRKVEPSLIRTEADEATYNLHIMVRFDIEKALFNGSLAVSALPEIWNEKMKEYLGIMPPDDRSGVLQDVHWACGLFGYFPTYALGNLIGAQVWEKLIREVPGVRNSIAEGDLSPVLNYLRTHLYRFGAKDSPRETLRKLLGTDTIDSTAFLRRMREQYLED